MENVMKKRLFLEALLIMILVVVSPLFPEQVKGLIAFVPIIYFFVERGVRKRNQSEVGRLRDIPKDLVENWYWILLVLVVFQVFFFLLYKYAFPDILTHVKSRIPIVSVSQFSVPLLLLLLIGPFGEEIIFRGLFQNRLNWFVRTPIAILFSSLAFAFAHFTTGQPLTVGMDMLSVFVDGIVFGIIFAKTKNMYTSWVVHAVSDIFAMFLLLLFT